MQKNWKRIFWTICVVGLCIIDQRVGSSPGEPQLIFTNSVMLVLGSIMLTHYSLKDFNKLPYWVWGIISLVAAPVAIIWGSGYFWFPGRFRVMVCVIVMYGFLFIRTIQALILEKKRPNVHSGLLLVLILFVCMAGISRYDNKWEILYLAMFVLWYLTAFTHKERRTLLLSLQEGILISFFLIQGLAFLFRPYDTLRYLGMYSNTNMNALFYQAVYCAFLSKFCMLETTTGFKKGSAMRSILWKWCCFAFASAMWSFVLLTMCRSAFLGMGTATLLGFAYCVKNHTGRKRKDENELRELGKGKVWCWNLWCGIRYFILLGVLVVGSFPVVYGAVRYLPPLFHHPVWFFSEYSEDKVHSWDPYDSPKYTDWKEVLTENFGRFTDLLPGSLIADRNGEETQNPEIPEVSDDQEISKMQEESKTQEEPTTQEIPDTQEASKTQEIPDTQEVSTAQEVPEIQETIKSDNTEMEESDNLGGKANITTAQTEEESNQSSYQQDVNTEEHFKNQDSNAETENVDPQDNQEPILGDTEEFKSTSARLVIYSHYLKQLNWMGHSSSENGIQVTADYFAPHAHNLFLQYAFQYGIPAGIVFFLFLAAGGLRLLYLCFAKQKEPFYLPGLLLFAATVVFGLTEAMWRSGLLSYNLMFLLPYIAWGSKRTELEE